MFQIHKAYHAPDECKAQMERTNGTALYFILTDEDPNGSEGDPTAKLLLEALSEDGYQEWRPYYNPLLGQRTRWYFTFTYYPLPPELDPAN